MERLTLCCSVIVFTLSFHLASSFPSTTELGNEKSTPILYTDSSGNNKSDSTIFTTQSDTNVNIKVSDKKENNDNLKQEIKVNNTKSEFNSNNVMFNNALMSSIPVLQMLNAPKNFKVNLMNTDTKVTPTIHIINNINKNIETNKKKSEKVLSNTFDSILSKPLPSFEQQEDIPKIKSKRIYPDHTDNDKSRSAQSATSKINSGDQIKESVSTENIPNVKPVEYPYNETGYKPSPQNSNLVTRKGKYLDNGFGIKTNEHTSSGHDSLTVRQGQEESKNIRDNHEIPSLNVTSHATDKPIIYTNNSNGLLVPTQGNTEKIISDIKYIASNGKNKNTGNTNIKLDKVLLPPVTPSLESVKIKNSETKEVDKLLYVVEKENDRSSFTDAEYNIENLPKEFFQQVPRKLNIVPDKSVQLALQREINALNAFSKLSEQEGTLKDVGNSQRNVESGHVYNNSANSGNAHNNKNIVGGEKKNITQNTTSQKKYDVEISSNNQKRVFSPHSNNAGDENVTNLSDQKQHSGSRANETASLSKFQSNLDMYSFNKNKSTEPPTKTTQRGISKYQNIVGGNTNPSESLEYGIKVVEKAEKLTNNAEIKSSKINNKEAEKNIGKEENTYTVSHLNKTTEQTSHNSHIGQTKVAPDKSPVRWIQVEPTNSIKSSNATLGASSIGALKNSGIFPSRRDGRIDQNVQEIKDEQSTDQSKVIRIQPTNDKERTSDSVVTTFGHQITQNIPNGVTIEKITNINSTKEKFNIKINESSHGIKPQNVENKPSINAAKISKESENLNTNHESTEKSHFDSRKTTNSNARGSARNVVKYSSGKNNNGLQTEESSYYGNNFNNERTQYNEQINEEVNNFKVQKLSRPSQNDNLRISLSTNESKQTITNTQLSDSDGETPTEKTPQNDRRVFQSNRQRNLSRGRQSNYNYPEQKLPSRETTEKSIEHPVENIQYEKERGQRKYSPTRFETISPYMTDSATNQLYNDRALTPNSNFVTPLPGKTVDYNHPRKKASDVNKSILTENDDVSILSNKEASDRSKSSRPYRGSTKYKYVPINYDWSYDDINYPTQFSYNYKAPDDTSVYQKGVLKEINNKKVFIVQGSYKYTAPDGTPILVTYTADERGFHPQETIVDTVPKKSKGASESSPINEFETLHDSQNSLSNIRSRKSKESSKSGETINATEGYLKKS